MRIVQTTVALVLIVGAVVSAQVAPPVAPPATQPPAPESTAPPATEQPAPASPTPQQPPPAGAKPTAPDPAAPASVVPAPVVPPVPLGARTFTAPTGIIFSAVRKDRTVDFEMVIGYLQAAFEKSTDADLRAQAQGWRVFRATEPGPNGTVLYVFVIDPTVAKAEYGLGAILSSAYPDQIQEIWKLYTGALAGGGSLLNLTPVQPPPLPPPGTPKPTTPAPTPRPAPPAAP